MYRKVKVREEKNRDYEDVAVDHNINFDSLSLHVSSSPVDDQALSTKRTEYWDCEDDYLFKFSSIIEKEHQEVSPRFIARIPVSYATTNTVTPTISARKETEKNDVKIEEKDRPNIRASPILRPRAVLSSPDNDAVIGNKNRIKAEHPTALRNRNLVKNRHLNAKCKTPSLINAKGQTNTNLLNDTTTMDNKSEQKGKKGSTMAIPSQRRYLRTGKSGPEKS